MQTQHDSLTDRRMTPRRLLPRRHPRTNDPRVQSASIQMLQQPNPVHYKAGDELTFRKADGWIWNLTILGIDGEQVDAMMYNGMPHHIPLTLGDLDRLRILSIREHDNDFVTMYRKLVGLDVEASSGGTH